YMVGVIRPGRAELKAAGKNRMTMPLWVDCVSTPSDQETALQQAGVLYQAVLYVLETLESAALANVSPPIAAVLVGAASVDARVDLDHAGLRGVEPPRRRREQQLRAHPGGPGARPEGAAVADVAAEGLGRDVHDRGLHRRRPAVPGVRLGGRLRRPDMDLRAD